MISLKELGNRVSKSAPLLGAMISTLNPMAGLVVTSIAHIFGANPENLDDVANKIMEDVDATTKLQYFELQHQEVLQKNQLIDIANARDREEQITKIIGKRDYILPSLAFCVVFGFFGLCGIIYGGHNADDHIVSILVGQLSSGFMLVLSYYFGSSNEFQIKPGIK